MSEMENKVEEVTEVASQPVETLEKAEKKTRRFDKDRKFKRNDRPEKEFEERVVKINRITKVVKGGRRMRFAALVVVGDKKGRIGFGTGKAKEVPDAIKKATEMATKNVKRVSLVDNTLPHETVGVYGAAKVVLRPAATGTGVIAGGPARAVIEMAGIKNIRTKSLGSNNKQNVVLATIDGLASVSSPEAVAKKRGKSVDEIMA